ncbi:MAG: NHLP family bacteriocin export ABC transporter peptidase/permease/ATPase subunit [Oscillospiraceae bacterium]
MYCKTPTVFQMEATECGAASLAMILAYHKHYEPLEKLRIETGVSRDGSNALRIKQAAETYGLICHGYRKEPAELDQLPVPAILHWNFNHFVVYEGRRGERYLLNDPASGRRSVSRQEMDISFTGVVLTFEKGEHFQKNRKPDTIFSTAKKRLKGQWNAVFALLLFGLCLVLPGIAMTLYSQVFIDDILLGGNRAWTTPLLYAMGFTILFQLLLHLYRSLVLQRLQCKLSLLSAHGFLSHLLRLPMTFFDQRMAGDLANRVDNNDNISDFLAGDLAETALNLFTSCFYFLLMLFYSPLLTAVGLLTTAVNLLLAWVCSGSLEQHSTKLQQDFGQMLGTFFSGLSISATLKSIGAERVFASRLLGYYAKTSQTEQTVGRVQLTLNVLPQAFGYLSNILVLLVGGLLIIDGRITAGMLVAFTVLLQGFVDPINDLVNFSKKIQVLKADIHRVDDIERYEKDGKFLTDTDELIPKVKLSGRVDIHDLSFGYSPLEPPIIQDFQLTLTPGRSVALVGASGSGKSTVGKVLSGLYGAWGGQVLLDGQPIGSIPKEVLCSSVATVSQEVMLFSGTVRDNLTLWNRHIGDEDLVQAAKDACIHDIITRKPGAYDYMLQEGGKNLSGGQRQRLEIARALVQNPSLLIMDEATSALDPLTEQEIINRIKRRGCACVIVAHRLSAIRDCDEILVLERGRVVQRGSHEELIHQEGHYQRLLGTM